MFSVNVVVFDQNLLILGKVVVLGQNGCIRAIVVVFGHIGCVRAKVVVFGQNETNLSKWLYSGKSGCKGAN